MYVWQLAFHLMDFFLYRKCANRSAIRVCRGPSGARLSIPLQHFLLFMQRQGTCIFLFPCAKFSSRLNPRQIDL